MMRVSEERIKQAILHSEQDVRNAAVYYFSDSFSSDPGIMPVAIQAIDKYGWKDAFIGYSFMEDLIQTQPTVRWLIEELKRLEKLEEQGEDEEDRDYYADSLTRALTWADLAILEPLKEELLALDELSDEAREALAERVMFRTFTTEQLWAELNEWCQVCEEEEDAGDVDFAYRVVEALSRHGAASADQVLAILDDEDNVDTLKENQAIRLAGEITLQAAIPQIAWLLHDCDDDTDEEARQALTKIGTDAVVSIWPMRSQKRSGTIGCQPPTSSRRFTRIAASRRAWSCPGSKKIKKPGSNCWTRQS